MAIARCNWRVLGHVLRKAMDMRIGDVWITDRKHYRARIVDIEAVGGARLRFWIKNPKVQEPYALEPRALDDAVTTEGERGCYNAVCDLHVRELSEAFHICAAHWSSQLEAVGR